MTEPLRLLFVCTANICRSPFMELYARSVSTEDLHFSSAGTHGLDAEPMGAEMAGELSARDVDCSGFRSRRLTAEMVSEADLVLTAERVHRRFLLDDQPEDSRKVLTLGQAVHAAPSVPSDARGRDALVELAHRRGTAGEDSDVTDPYGRGPVATAEAADRITAMLDQLLPLLSYIPSARKPPHA